MYASSAATYGAGENGYNDDHEAVAALKPLNPYGVSKNEFDKWALAQTERPANWTGLKFFNVYGPGEYHKGRMASVIFHAFSQIKETGKVKLFKSHKPDYQDGEQLRDFIYVKDVVAVIGWMLESMLNNKWQALHNGHYNLGTGKARSFIDLVRSTFAGLDLEPNIEFIEMPIDIRDTYQYFTEANMEKLMDVGYPGAFTSLEDGVQDYVVHYLQKELIY
jgi:ADP-L-glycero-D-manno-heptose 6-epimerase